MFKVDSWSHGIELSKERRTFRNWAKAGDWKRFGELFLGPDVGKGL